jgi:putative ABC transport system permease protein
MFATGDTTWRGGLGLDLKATMRALERRPTFVIAVVATLALGLGATTAVFSVDNSVLLRPLSFARPERLVAVWPNTALANREIDLLRTNSRAFEQVAGFSPGWLMSLTGVVEPRQLNVGRVTGDMFAMLGATPMLGRIFDRQNERCSRDIRCRRV